MTQTTLSSLDDLKSAVLGEVVTPADPGYDEARNIWNGAIDKKPSVIVRCAAAGDVSAAIGYAKSAGLEVSVRGGGHNYAGFALVDGGLTVDLTLMRSVAVDPAARRATCGGGVTWGELDAACQEHALAVPGGFISHTGVGGLTLGGGIGWLSRKAGLSCDNLIGAEVVLADGAIVRASETENPDLLWALRGGGGNFGVVTAFEFQAHQAGPMLNLGLFFWGLDQGREMLRFARELTRDLPDDVTAFIAGLNAPPEEFVPEQYRFMPGYALLLASFGPAGEHAVFLDKVRAAVPPLFEFVTPIPFVALQQLFNASAPWGMLAYEKAVHLDELSDAAIDVITEQLPKKRSPLSILPIFPMGGAYARVPEDAAAFGGSRATRFVVNISAGADDPQLLAAEREWVRTFWAALVPHASGIGSYVNFMSEYEEDRVRAAYGPEKYARLSAIKAKYDPDNVFHINANIKPT